MQIQYFATAVARRRNGRSSSSTARASRRAVALAASESRQRSASTFWCSGCSASRRPKAARCAAWCVASATARRMSAVEPSTQSRRVCATISMIVATPRPSSPSRAAQRVAELDLGRGVGAVAELVLEPPDVEAVAAPVREDARQHEAREPAGGVREHEEDVAHRRRAEPLLARERVAAVRERLRARLVGAHVGASLPLRERHPGEETRLVCRGAVAPARTRGPSGPAPTRPSALDPRVARGSRSTSSTAGSPPRPRRRRASRTVRRGRRAARLRVGPRCRVHAVLHADTHELVPGGMETRPRRHGRRNDRRREASACSRSRSGRARAARLRRGGRTPRTPPRVPRRPPGAAPRRARRPARRGRSPRVAAAGSRRGGTGTSSRT